MPAPFFIAPANIFVGGTAPATGVEITVDADGIPSTGGTNVGMTGGPATFRIGGDFHESEVEQAMSPVHVRKVKEEVEVEFVMRAIDFSVLQKFMNGSVITTDTTSDPKTHMVSGGGDGCVDTNVVTLVTADPCADGDDTYYLVVCLYEAYASSDFEIQFGKDVDSEVTVTMRGLADTTRPKGDQVYQVVQQYTV